MTMQSLLITMVTCIDAKLWKLYTLKNDKIITIAINWQGYKKTPFDYFEKDQFFNNSY